MTWSKWHYGYWRHGKHILKWKADLDDNGEQIYLSRDPDIVRAILGCDCGWEYHYEVEEGEPVVELFYNEHISFRGQLRQAIKDG